MTDLPCTAPVVELIAPPVAAVVMAGVAKTNSVVRVLRIQNS